MNRYESYKDSGIPWLGEVPAHWDVKRLKFLGDIILGLTYSPENITNEDNGTLVLRSSNIQNGKLVFEDNVFVNSDIPQKMITTEQDILICSRNGSRSLIGKCALIEKYGLNQTFGAFMTVFRTPYRKFVYYALNSEIFKSQLGLFLTSTINQLTTQVLGNFNIAFPPRDEQTAIAHYLDTKLGEIDALIDKQQTLLEKLAEQRTAVITHAVTKGLNPATQMKNSGVEWLGDVPAHWEIIKNKYILEFSKGLTITKENLINDGIPCVSYGEIHSKYGFEVNPEKHFLKCVSEEYLENNDHAYLKNGDFVFADTSEDVKGSGNFTYLNSNLPVFAGYHTIVARPNLRKVLPRFLAYVFDSNAHRNQIRAMVKGVKVFSITQAFLKNTFSWLPSKKEQTAIAEYLDQETAKIDRLCETVNQTIGRLKEYRTALITQAVTGKIKVTDE